jgi:hypothetical protein
MPRISYIFTPRDVDILVLLLAGDIPAGASPVVFYDAASGRVYASLRNPS